MNDERESRGFIPGGLIDFPCSDDWGKYYERKGVTSPLLPILLDLLVEVKKLNLREGRGNGCQRTSHPQP